MKISEKQDCASSNATIVFKSQLVSCMAETRTTHAGANTRLQLLLENCKLKKEHNHVKKNNLRITSPTGIGSPFDSYN